MSIEAWFTDRHGGTSLPPYNTLNLAGHVGDDASAVAENVGILRERFRLERLVRMNQVHSDAIVTICGIPVNMPECDAMITDRKDLALMVLVADCQPILLFDSTRGVIAVVHAGREGTRLNIASKCVRAMHERFGCDSKEIRALIGPGIHACCYEVSEPMAAAFAAQVGEAFVSGRNLDLPAANAAQLRAEGVAEEHIERNSVCTCCSKDYFSYRREGVTGRFAGIIVNRTA